MHESKQKLVQILMVNGALIDTEFKSTCEELFDQEFSQHDLDELRESIAKELRSYSLDIKQTMYDNGHMYIGVVNLSNDSLAAMSSNFKPWEIVFFRKAIVHIVENEDGEIDRLELSNLRDGTNKVSEVRALVDQLLQQKWLAFSIFNDDQITLGIRAFLELSVFIRGLGVLECMICHADVLQCVRCKTRDCPTRVHESCLQEHQKGGRAYHCATCRKPLR
ncbi:hypothetical protein, variant 1 [Aphanomyces astaci]|uniref:Non-structural maintenance of chromosomes element 1 homolog n=1 Tax=Aphanomyces astaci TaxID=112090 RepID=W4FME2_APHAT|nr:hypothetical protein, variant 2 [Aphanomyces astaci]XP_009842347.1 hypothetical protein, variant 1 [Aphanomyces astaci]ETV68046.1 hypothetical protein, variant 1 [Aphanomyces astaci]ETV68047.1 hypothetical protein, variant 2 [Aphanomyces astaci]KAF0724772.1 hypothetical protein AaE_009760 [Aphanomyces astaci]|eukprot:XP_009842346.1 hypothetical protein, variant 2 [Aphanomyces astaci]